MRAESNAYALDSTFLDCIVERTVKSSLHGLRHIKLDWFLLIRKGRLSNVTTHIAYPANHASSEPKPTQRNDP